MIVVQLDRLQHQSEHSLISLNFRRMKLKKEIQAIKELNEQEKAAQAAKASQMGGGGCDGPPDSV